MKKIALQLLLVGFTFIAVSFASSSVKNVYSTTEGKMKISFPGEFEVSKMDENTTKIVSVVDNANYFCTFTLNDAIIEDQETLAQSSLDGFNEVLEGTINKKSVWKVQKNNGLKAEIDVTSIQAKVQYQVVLIGKVHYQLVVIAGYKDFDQKKMETFMKSFKVLK